MSSSEGIQKTSFLSRVHDIYRPKDEQGARHLKKLPTALTITMAVLLIVLVGGVLQNFHVIDALTPIKDFIANPMPMLNTTLNALKGAGTWLITPLYIADSIPVYPILPVLGVVAFAILCVAICVRAKSRSKDEQSSKESGNAPVSPVVIDSINSSNISNISNEDLTLSDEDLTFHITVNGVLYQYDNGMLYRRDNNSMIEANNETEEVVADVIKRIENAYNINFKTIAQNGYIFQLREPDGNYVFITVNNKETKDYGIKNVKSPELNDYIHIINHSKDKNVYLLPEEVEPAGQGAQAKVEEESRVKIEQSSESTPEVSGTEDGLLTSGEFHITINGEYYEGRGEATYRKVADNQYEEITDQDYQNVFMKPLMDLIQKEFDIDLNTQAEDGYVFVLDQPDGDYAFILIDNDEGNLIYNVESKDLMSQVLNEQDENHMVHFSKKHLSPIEPKPTCLPQLN